MITGADIITSCLPTVVPNFRYPSTAASVGDLFFKRRSYIFLSCVLILESSRLLLILEPDILQTDLDMGGWEHHSHLR